MSLIHEYAEHRILLDRSKGSRKGMRGGRRAERRKNRRARRMAEAERE